MVAVEYQVLRSALRAAFDLLREYASTWQGSQQMALFYRSKSHNGSGI